jgi:hypothetical protein
MHAIKPGDSGTISFQNLPFGNYVLKYMVRDAAGRTSGIQQITFTIGRKPDISIISVQNRYVSLNVPANPASFQWTADTGSFSEAVQIFDRGEWFMHWLYAAAIPDTTRWCYYRWAIHFWLYGNDEYFGDSNGYASLTTLIMV